MRVAKGILAAFGLSISFVFAYTAYSGHFPPGFACSIVAFASAFIFLP